MAWSYRRRVKIIPGVHLNFSKNGISTSIGIRGANMTFGKTGTYLNTSIPGLGIYERRKISESSINPMPEQLNIQPFDIQDNIFSADIHEITSQDMYGVKDAIIAAHDQKIELKKDLLKIKTSLLASKFKLFSSYFFLIWFFKKSIIDDIKTDINSKKEAIKQLIEQIENCYVDLDIEFDLEIKIKYDKVVEAFKNLCKCKKIWDVTSAFNEDTKVTRSAASTTVKKREVKFGIKAIDDIKSEFEPLWFKNANGADLYFYPNFIVMHSSKKKFALVGLNELNFYHNSIRL